LTLTRRCGGRWSGTLRTRPKTVEPSTQSQFQPPSASRCSKNQAARYAGAGRPPDVSSFHSTLNALKGLLCYESVTGGTDAIRAARRCGEEYLLRRNLSKRLSSGEPVGPWVSRFAYPFRWFYSVLYAADYFRAASLLDDRSPDPRMAEAIEQIRAARQPDGTWIQERRHPGRVWLEVDVDAGEPSKWLTHCATRVLEWWDASDTGR
jgi:hypothetical protein